MSKQGGSAHVLIIVIILLVASAYYLGRISSPAKLDQEPQIIQSSNKEDSSCNTFFCWVKTADGVAGYGDLEGYYTTYQIKNKSGEMQNCSGLKVRVLDSDPTFNNINGTKINGDTIYVDLNAHPQYKDLIKNSTKNHPISFTVFQKPAGGHGIDGCGWMDYTILDVKQAR